MFKFYKTVSEEDQYLLYDVDKDYGFFFNKWGVYGHVEEQGYLCEIDVIFDDFYTNFQRYILKEELEKAQKEIITTLF